MATIVWFTEFSGITEIIVNQRIFCERRLAGHWHEGRPPLDTDINRLKSPAIGRGAGSVPGGLCR
jgi:hypothetical protein